MSRAAEIVDSFIRKKTSITVLAQLYDCSSDDIIELLESEGIDPKTRTRKAKLPKRLAAYHKSVLNDIAEEIEVHERTASDEEAELEAEREKFKAYEQKLKNTIFEHKEAVRALRAELEEEQLFFEMFS